MLHKMHAEHPFPPSSQEIASLVRQLVERVGAERLVYGSVRISKQTSHRPAGSERWWALWGQDMPSCEEVVTYRQSYSLWSQRAFLPFLTDAQRAAVLGGNLAKIYPPDRAAQL